MALSFVKENCCIAIFSFRISRYCILYTSICLYLFIFILRPVLRDYSNTTGAICRVASSLSLQGTWPMRHIGRKASLAKPDRHRVETIKMSSFFRIITLCGRSVSPGDRRNRPQRPSFVSRKNRPGHGLSERSRHSGKRNPRRPKGSMFPSRTQSTIRPFSGYDPGRPCPRSAR
jgi:hypothetical protein